MISHVITVIVLIGLAMAAAGLYLLPVLVGWARHVPGLAAIAVIDLLLGWTFVGWVAALALALRPVYPAGPLVQLVQHLPAAAVCARPARPCRVGGATRPAAAPARLPPPLLLPPPAAPAAPAYLPPQPGPRPGPAIPRRRLPWVKPRTTPAPPRPQPGAHR